jgi:hypothetical protein
MGALLLVLGQAGSARHGDDLGAAGQGAQVAGGALEVGEEVGEGRGGWFEPLPVGGEHRVAGDGGEECRVA